MSISRHIEALYREESRRVLATLIRLLGDFDLAEEALQDAFTAAVTQWPVDGVPDNPRAWLISAGRFKAIYRLRRRAVEKAVKLELGTYWPRESRKLLSNGRRPARKDAGAGPITAHLTGSRHTIVWCLCRADV